MRSDVSTYQSKATTIILVISVITLFVFLPLLAVSKTKPLTIVSENVFQDSISHLDWQIQRSKRIKTEKEVQLYIQTINHGEHNDWRLPTKQELYEIFSVFDLKLNGEVKVRLEGNYWLADDNGQAYVGAWEIGDQCGPSRSFSRGKAGFVRAVRP